MSLWPPCLNPSNILFISGSTVLSRAACGRSVWSSDAGGRAAFFPSRTDPISYNCERAVVSIGVQGSKDFVSEPLPRPVYALLGELLSTGCNDARLWLPLLADDANP